MATTSDAKLALLAINNGYITARWNFPDAVGSAIDTPAGVGNAVTVTYSFLTSLPAYQSEPGFRVFSAGEESATRDIFAEFSHVANISFTEIATGGSIGLGMHTMGADAGYAYFPTYSYSFSGGVIVSVSQPESVGDVWIDSSTAWTAADFEANGTGFGVLLHEVGHAVGLKHPFSEGNTLPAALDNQAYTVMAYNVHSNSLFRTVTENSPGSYTWQYHYIEPETLMPLDIIAVQHLYGANNSYKTGNDIYTFDTDRPFIKTIWDAGGTDTISVSNFTLGTTIDLREGSYSSITILSDDLPAGSVEGNTGIYDGTDNLAIAYDTVIENAIGGSGADHITGNDSDNELTGGGGNDTLVGGGGDDQAIYSGNRADYSVVASAGGYTVTASASSEGTDTLTGIEEIVFADETLTLGASNQAPTGTVTITGSAEEDQTLSADTSAIADGDGLGTFSYQWYRDNVAFSATGSSYQLVQADVGSKISVTVSYTDGASNSESLSSAQTATVTNVNDDATGAPVIVGTSTEGQTLTLNLASIADEDGVGAFSYQWLRDGSNIATATGSSYQLVQADVGHAISVRVTFTDDLNSDESLTSSATAAVANGNDSPTGSVVISGTTTQGQTLTADPSGISDDDGLGAFSYQWYRNGVAISATDASYELVQADVGNKISVIVSYTDNGGTAESVGSGQTATIANVNDAATGAPIIVGTTTEDQTLTLNLANIADEDGLGSFSYQWLRDGSSISGATASNYTLGQEDVNHNISVRVSFTDALGSAESRTSSQTAAIANINDSPTGSATIVGNPLEGETLTANTATIADEDGLGAFSYQWLRNGSAIVGATQVNYLLNDDDIGSTISVRVSYQDAFSRNESLTSSATAAIEAVIDGTLVIRGVAAEDQTLTADTDNLAADLGQGDFSYQWFSDGVAINGATSATFILGQQHVGAQISATVTYDDLNLVETNVASSQTSAVLNVNDDPSGSLVLTGTAQQGLSLTVEASAIADDDGLGAFSYQWLRDGVAVAGATGTRYLLVEADVDSQISVQVSYTDGENSQEQVLSAALTVIAEDAPNSEPEGLVVIDGLATLGNLLTADTSGLSDADGLGEFSYQWLREGIAIAGATAESYTVVNDDISDYLSVNVAYTDDRGSNEMVESHAKYGIGGDSASYIDLIELYVAILDRSPAIEGLSFWAAVLAANNNDLNYVATEMWNSPGAKLDYPEELSVEEIVETVYSNILGRAPQPAGLEFWVKEWEAFGPAETMLIIINNLKNNPSTDPQYLLDKALFDNKVQFGRWFSTEFSEQEPDLAKTVSETITSDPSSVTDAIEFVQLEVLGQVVLPFTDDIIVA